MYGWLLGKNKNKILLIKISIENTKIKTVKGTIDKNNATYYTNEFKIIEIVDEYCNKYYFADINKIIDEKYCKKVKLELNETYTDFGIFFYINTERALDDIYLFDNKYTGIAKQYLLNGELVEQITLNKGLQK
jgi:hypothetical protein